MTQPCLIRCARQITDELLAPEVVAARRAALQAACAAIKPRLANVATLTELAELERETQRLEREAGTLDRQDNLRRSLVHLAAIWPAESELTN